jgi:hypothetical protein
MIHAETRRRGEKLSAAGRNLFAQRRRGAESKKLGLAPFLSLSASAPLRAIFFLAAPPRLHVSASPREQNLRRSA